MQQLRVGHSGVQGKSPALPWGSGACKLCPSTCSCSAPSLWEKEPSAASGCTHLSSLSQGGWDSWAKLEHRICGECSWVISVMMTVRPPPLSTHSLPIPGVRISYPSPCHHIPLQSTVAYNNTSI